jgi:oxalate decarboxylase
VVSSKADRNARKTASAAIEEPQVFENTGSENLVFPETFAASESAESSLNQWLRAMPAQVATAHTNFSAEELEKIPAEAKLIFG